MILSADLRGWFTPTVFHPLFGGDIVRELHLVQQRALNPDLPGFRDLNTVFLGWVSLALAVMGAVAYRRKLEAWIWTTVLFGLFTLGPLLQINGRTQFDLDGIDTTVPLPFALLHYLPVIKANRAPNRNSVVLMLGLAVLAGYGVLWLLGRLERWQEGREARAKKPSFSKKLGFWPLIVVAGVLRWSHPFRASGAAVPTFRCAHPSRVRTESPPTLHRAACCSCHWAGATALASLAPSRRCSSTTRRRTAPNAGRQHLPCARLQDGLLQAHPLFPGADGDRVRTPRHTGTAGRRSGPGRRAGLPL